jgi:UDP-N-acetylglucosamine:LPS N-acetylglucosamine transferase
MRYTFLMTIFFTSLFNAETSFEKKKILIITYPGGHTAISDALKSRLEKYYSLNVFTDRTGEKFLAFFYRYNLGHLWCSISHTPILNRIGQLLSRFRKLDFSVKDYDLIITCTSFWYPFLKQYKKPVLTVVSDVEDYSTSDWLQSSDQNFILGTSRLVEQANKKGFTKYTQVNGMILRECFTDIRNIDKQDMKEKLGLQKDKRNILVCFGSFGTGGLLEVAKQLRNNAEDNVIFICGKMEEIKDQIQSHNSNYTVLGYVENMHEYMRAADVFIGKPGPGCLYECIQCETPCIFLNKNVMPQEQHCLEIVRGTRIGTSPLGVIIDNYEELDSTIQEACTNPIYKQNMSMIENDALDETEKVIQNILK